jgi:2-keto-4-pentenoate hydratase/2-oxohepta-3-ene-1,7-dioic acid hydratase in catechol pathway
VPKGNPAATLIGEPTDAALDVGVAVRQGQTVQVNVFAGASVLSPGAPTGTIETIGKLLAPLAPHEVGTIRCIGLNYKKHAVEVGMVLPDMPTVFLKPDTALTGPGEIVLPRLTQLDNCGDYESELAVVIGRTAKNVSEADALDHVLGYTACNDVSSRTSQLSQSQWCFSKGFDGACPIGPTIVSKELIPDPSALHVRGIKNGVVLQDSGVDDLIFAVPKIISFLSQSTTLRPGTVIITGTPAGVGMGRSPKETLQEGDEFAVEILPHIGTLSNTFVNEA